MGELMTSPAAAVLPASLWTLRQDSSEALLLSAETR